MAQQAWNNESDQQARRVDDAPSDRITRIQRRYQTGVPHISVQRARYYTESWRRTEGQGLPDAVRVARAMKNVYANMTHCVDRDDRIAGAWTEFFMGIPIDIERGVFNGVLEVETQKNTLIRFRARSLAGGLRYMARKGVLREFFRNQKITRASGTPPLNFSLKTMAERPINPFQIDTADRKLLVGNLLPYWKGRCLVDHLEKELIRSGLYSTDMHDFVVALPGNTSRQVLMVSTCATISTMQGHVILDYEQVLNLGLEAMLRGVEDELDKLPDGNEAQATFLESVRIALQGIILYCQGLASQIARAAESERDPTQVAKYERMLATCSKVPLKPAESFEEAVQALWTLKTAVELAHPVNLHCFGRLDQILFPYYEADRKKKRIEREQARELLEELLLKVMSQNIRPESNVLANFYHRFLGSTPITLAGMDSDGRDATNELSYLFLEAAHRSKAITNISVRVHQHTPDDLLDCLAKYLQQGTSSFSLFNDDTHIEAMTRRGFTLEHARDYALMGCVETTCPGRTGSMSANAMQLSRLLDITLRNGDSRTIAGTIRAEGLPTGDPQDMKTFDDLLEAFLAQGRHFMAKLVDASNLRDRLYAERLPAPCISAFIDGCMDKKKDVTHSGGRYDLSGISMINAVANVVDSLYVIKKLVYERRAFTIRELLEAVDDNFVGHSQIDELIRTLPGKWGNGDPETDELAHHVMGELFAETYKPRSYKDAPFVVYVISMITHTIDGRLSIATPDGRRAATPYAASCNPYNVEREGVTAALRSVAALPFQDVMGSAVNIKFHPSAIGKTPEARAKWIGLIRTYFRLGGAQIQPTVVDAKTLRLAQQKPEAYRDLIVKVGGYSTYFVDLGQDIQQEIIDRTEHR